MRAPAAYHVLPGEVREPRAACLCTFCGRHLQRTDDWAVVTVDMRAGLYTAHTACAQAAVR